MTKIEAIKSENNDRAVEFDPLETRVQDSVINGNKGEYYGKYKIELEETPTSEIGVQQYRYHKYGLEYGDVGEWDAYHTAGKTEYKWPVYNTRADTTYEIKRDYLAADKDSAFGYNSKAYLSNATKDIKSCFFYKKDGAQKKAKVAIDNALYAFSPEWFSNMVSQGYINVAEDESVTGVYPLKTIMPTIVKADGTIYNSDSIYTLSYRGKMTGFNNTNNADYLSPTLICARLNQKLPVNGVSTPKENSVDPTKQDVIELENLFWSLTRSEDGIYWNCEEPYIRRENGTLTTPKNCDTGTYWGDPYRTILNREQYNNSPYTLTMFAPNIQFRDNMSPDDPNYLKTLPLRMTSRMAYGYGTLEPINIGVGWLQGYHAGAGIYNHSLPVNWFWQPIDGWMWGDFDDNCNVHPNKTHFAALQAKGYTVLCIMSGGSGLKTKTEWNETLQANVTKQAWLLPKDSKSEIKYDFYAFGPDSYTDGNYLYNVYPLNLAYFTPNYMSGGAASIYLPDVGFVSDTTSDGFVANYTPDYYLHVYPDENMLHDNYRVYDVLPTTQKVEKTSVNSYIIYSDYPNYGYNSTDKRLYINWYNQSTYTNEDGEQFIFYNTDPTAELWEIYKRDFNYTSWYFSYLYGGTTKLIGIEDRIADECCGWPFYAIPTLTMLANNYIKEATVRYKSTFKTYLISEEPNTYPKEKFVYVERGSTYGGLLNSRTYYYFDKMETDIATDIFYLGRVTNTMNCGWPTDPDSFYFDEARAVKYVFVEKLNDEDFYPTEYLGEEVFYGTDAIGLKEIGDQTAHMGYYYKLAEVGDWDGRLYPNVVQKIKYVSKLGNGKIDRFGGFISAQLELTLRPLPQKLLSYLETGDWITFESDAFGIDRFYISESKYNTDRTTSITSLNSLEALQGINIDSLADGVTTWPTPGKGVVYQFGENEPCPIEPSLGWATWWLNNFDGEDYKNVDTSAPIFDRMNKYKNTNIYLELAFKGTGENGQAYYTVYSQIDNSLREWLTNIGISQFIYAKPMYDMRDASFFDFYVPEDKGKLDTEKILKTEVVKNNYEIQKIFFNNTGFNGFFKTGEIENNTIPVIYQDNPFMVEAPPFRYKYEKGDAAWAYQLGLNKDYVTYPKLGKPLLPDIFTTGKVTMIGEPLTDEGYINVGDFVSFDKYTFLDNDLNTVKDTRQIIVTQIETDFYTTTLSCEVDIQKNELKEYKFGFTEAIEDGE